MTETTPVSSILRQIAPIKIAAWRLAMEKQQDFMAQFEIAFRDRHNLTLNEFDTLINTPPDEQIRQRARLLRRLEARRIVTQTPDPEDQRGVLVELTEAGRKLREEAAETNA